MTPARSLAASVVAFGIAGTTLTGPLPAHAAATPCGRAENYAAQSGAELLRIDRLEVRPESSVDRPTTEDPETTGDAAPPGPSTSPSRPASPHPPAPSGSSDDADDTSSKDNGTAGPAALGEISPGGVYGLADRVGALRSVTDGGVDRVRAIGSRVIGVGRLGSKNADSVDLGDTDDTRVTRVTRYTDDTSDTSEIGDTSDTDDGADADATGGSTTGGDATSGTPRNGAGSAGQTETGDSVRTGGGPSGTDGTGQDADQDTGRAGDDHIGRTGDQDADRRGAADGDGSKSVSLSGIGVGEARAAMIGTTRINSAAVARILDGDADGKAAWTEAILQQAPPTNERAATRSTPAGRIGPLKIDDGKVSARARWDAGMACGNTAGEAGRAHASVRGASILSSGNESLVRVPGKVGSMSTTALERRAGSAWTVASATVTAGRIELAGGKVRVRVLRPPSLVASMSADAGGNVHYRPALIEVSGDGIAARRLSSAGQHVDISLGPDRHTMESTTLDQGALGGVTGGSALPLPEVTGLPPVDGEPVTESAPAAGLGTKVRISLGAARQATKGNAIAARATAIKVTVAQGAGAGAHGTSGYADKPRAAVTLALAVGLLEAAAVAPGGRPGDLAGAGGQLPVTGPRVTGLAMGGATLLLAGVAAVILGMRRRRARS